MSRLVSGPLGTDDQQSSVRGNGHSTSSLQGQNISSDLTTSDPKVTMSETEETDSTMDISAGQKMLSAVSGSLLTSLLGTAPLLPSTLRFPY